MQFQCSLNAPPVPENGANVTQSEGSFFALPQPSLPVAGDRRRFPVRRIYCVGRNYVAHIREMEEGDERDPPFFFQKPTDAIVTDGAAVPYPQDTDDFQHEVELVVAIGGGGRNLSREQALEQVFGYAVGLDMTRRDRQFEARDMRRPWEMGKSFDHSAPCGTLRPATEGHVLSGAISVEVNGTPRQTGELELMIWNVDEIIANLSTQYELKPGDLIFTGTPAGVAAVSPGDQLLARIDGLEDLRVRIDPPLSQGA